VKHSLREVRACYDDAVRLLSARPWVRRLVRRRRLLPALLIAFLVLRIVCNALYRPNGWMEYRQKHAENQELLREVRQLQQEIEGRKRHIEDLRHNPRVLEDEARRQGYVRPGEIIFAPPKRIPGPYRGQNPVVPQGGPAGRDVERKPVHAPARTAGEIP
jgi:cell division protein FtsB